MKITPTVGKVAVEFLDEDDDPPKPSTSTSTPAPAARELLLATVVGVGPKVIGVKAGDTVAMSRWARENPTVGTVTICSAYEVVAKIGK